MRLLAGDIGGTNTRLAFVQDDCHPPTRHEKTYASSDYVSLIEIIEDFLLEYHIQKPLDVACLAVAGPVISGCASITNLPWHICEKELGELLQSGHASLINDLVAVGYAIPDLQSDDVLVVQDGENMRDAGIKLNAAVIAAGTGLGASHLVWQGDHYHVFSSEAGHTGFAPETAIQEQLLAWLHQQHAHVSVEMILSGPGIYTIYQFFRDIIGSPESGMVREAMRDTDPAQVISEHALAGDDALCVRTLDCFIEIYGAVAGDIALHYYPVNAVYLAGGIAPKIRGMLASQAFIEAFTNKGPMRNNLQKLPVKLVLNDSPGLDGAIAYARERYVRA
jgi:glucokinase